MSVDRVSAAVTIQAPECSTLLLQRRVSHILVDAKDEELLDVIEARLNGQDTQAVLPSDEHCLMSIHCYHGNLFTFILIDASMPGL